MCHWYTILLLCNVNKVTEQRNWDKFAQKIKCKWENEVNKTEMRLEREHERDCTQNLYVKIGRLNTEQVLMAQNKCMVDNIVSQNIVNLTL
jgi:hypothetical protein